MHASNPAPRASRRHIPLDSGAAGRRRLCIRCIQRDQEERDKRIDGAHVAAVWGGVQAACRTSDEERECVADAVLRGWGGEGEVDAWVV